ncbi:MAG: AAA family ATPase [Candidatus Thermoplasmatota archaeon]|nr:AAA family ATPase [Candidatus Thermoplasmatota archaeon]MBU4071163.1 AAA family ATPase [Candidatus Thermoplasmatota archaeon]MBU4145077.1 AAA family ATPase [Candidatus Thermoplasmatota archaeon]MBU4591054.1 AAA family ATPase [Candidatus Thermoplasmatota archaeon]
MKEDTVTGIIDKKGRIPNDLKAFFNSGGRSLILKGAPGTGKTTLALEILDNFSQECETCFISARIDEQALKRHLRWVDFEMLLSRGKDEGSRHTNKGTLSRKELDRLESRVEEGDESLEEDYNPGPGSGTVNGDTWTMDLTAILPEIDSLYDQLATDGSGKAMVAIDSVDSLSEKYGISTKRLIHTLQKDLVERSNVNVIFILETAENSSLDYMGDGVISLSMKEIGGRRLRLMKLDKLRGQSIRVPEIAFSLDYGRFYSFPDQSCISHVSKSGDEKIPIITLDGPLSGLTRPGEYTLFQIEGSVPTSIVQGLARAITLESATISRGIYTTPSLRLYGSRPMDKKHIGKHAETMKFISPTAMLRRNSVDPGTVQVDGESFAADFDFKGIAAMFPKSRSQLFLMDANQLLSHYGQAAIGDIENHIYHLIREGGTCINFTWPASNQQDMDLGMSHRLLKITNLGPHILLYGEKPHSPIYILASEAENPNARVFLQVL